MKYWRQRVLLALLRMAEQKQASRLQLMKWLFLLKEEKGIDAYGHFYDFFPYRYGPFSFVVYKDIDDLSRTGWIEQEEDWIRYIRGDSLPQKLLSASQGLREVEELLARYGNWPLQDLITYVYQKYPWYASRSEQKLHSLETKSSFQGVPAIYTIGYQGLSLDGFLNILLKTGIQNLIDIRSVPFSHKYGFSRTILSSKCNQIGINYYHFPKAGIPPEIRREVNDHTSLWSIYTQSLLPRIPNVVEAIGALCRTGRAALLCMEKAHHTCHRHLLAQVVSAQIGLGVVHL